MRIAALDLGSNSFHLLVADAPATGGFTSVLREKETLRLGDAVCRLGRIDDATVEKAASAARRLIGLARASGADPILVCATHAFREADNAGVLVRRIEAETGIAPRVVSGHEEARLVFEAVRASLTLEPAPALCLDLGGGSLELAIGDQHGVAWSASVPLGAARLTAELVANDPPSDDDLARVRGRIHDELGPLVPHVAAHGPRLLVGTSGVLCDLARMAASPAGIPVGRVNQVVAEWRDLVDVRDRIVSRTRRGRQRLAGLEARRAELAPAGAEVLLAAMEVFGFKRITVVRWALREGMVLDALRACSDTKSEANDAEHSVRRQAVVELARRCAWHETHGRHVARLAVNLFDQSQPLHGLDALDRELLEYGALLHDIGDHVSADAHHKHTAYLIEHSCLRGFSPEEVSVLACLGRFHRRGPLKTSYDPYRAMGLAARERVAALTALLRLADGLDRTRRQVVESLTLAAGAHARLEVVVDGDPELEAWSTRRKAQLFEDVFGCRLTIDVTGHEHLAVV